MAADVAQGTAHADTLAEASPPSVAITQTHFTIAGRSLVLARVAHVVLLAVLLLELLHYLGPVTAARARVHADLWRVNLPGMESRPVTILALFAAVGAWLAWARRHDAMALLVGANLVTAGSIPTQVAILAASPSTAWRLLAAALLTLTLALLYATLLVYPDGRPVPRWGLALLPVCGSLAAAYGIGWFVARRLLVATFTGVLLGLAIMMVCVLHRYRRHARSRQRSQLRWWAYGAIGYGTLQSATVIMGILWTDGPLAQGATLAVLHASYLFVLVCFTFSVVRYRLWDIDILINRTLVGALVTIFLGGGFALSFVALRALLDLVGLHEPTWSLVVPTALVAGLFAPVHRRVRRLVDRHLYHIGVAYEDVGKQAPTMLPAPHVMALAHRAGGFREIEPIGKGAMGEVFRARDARGELVAIKALVEKNAENRGLRARFLREALMMRRLDHPNIIRLRDLIEHEDCLYLVMEYIAGRDLASILWERRRLPLPLALPILEDVAAGLAAAHAVGLVHRDVKPGNIMVEGTVERPTRAVVMDFGLARSRTGSDDTQLTQNGGVIGTLDYISPEQITDATEVGPAADVYSLGATAYHVLTGRPPFVTASSLALLMAHMKQPPPDPRVFVDLPASTAAALLRALEKDPADRFPGPSAFAAALR